MVNLVKHLVKPFCRGFRAALSALPPPSIRTAIRSSTVGIDPCNHLRLLLPLLLQGFVAVQILQASSSSSGTAQILEHLEASFGSLAKPILSTRCEGLSHELCQH